ncbi:RluA family pseudouridine synthase [Bacillaceae bacterium Marseille-Q3522]|nr:RluA family pseudouridine synthase [Bacillaceae bacterium Marseille-Q3522]
MYFTLTWIIEQTDEGKIIRDFLKEKNISARTLTSIKYHGGQISVNGTEQNVRYPLHTGDNLKIVFPREERGFLIEEDIPLAIRYEDEYLLVVSKPANMNTIPSREHPVGSLANAIAGYYRKINLPSTVHIVTRLDRNTSGLVLIAKYQHVHHLFSKEQKNHLVKRTYAAFAEGAISEKTGKIEEPIGRKKDSIIEREVTSDGQYACTYFRVLHIYEQFSYLEVQLETGRTHQIRVHFAYIGHPLVGDDLYGGKSLLMERQALHCKSLSFYHPFKNKFFTFEEPLPADMRHLLDN